MLNLEEVLRRLRIVPVLTVDDAQQAVEVCRALRAGGLGGVEITLRTPAAKAAIQAVKATLPGFLVGAGTVKTVADVEAVAALEVDFAVSPGFSRRVSDSAFAHGVPLLPGIATASELMAGLDAGRHLFKFFPAEAIGGLPLLKSLAGPFPEALFCPTGGITPTNVGAYLAQPNVMCVGGSWMVAPELIRAGDWHQVEQLSREALASVAG